MAENRHFSMDLERLYIKKYSYNMGLLARVWTVTKLEKSKTSTDYGTGQVVRCKSKECRLKNIPREHWKWIGGIAMHDWNGNGKYDSGDSFMDFHMSKGGGSGGSSGCGYGC